MNRIADNKRLTAEQAAATWLGEVRAKTRIAPDQQTQDRWDAIANGTLAQQYRDAIKPAAGSFRLTGFDELFYF